MKYILSTSFLAGLLFFGCGEGADKMDKEREIYETPIHELLDSVAKLEDSIMRIVNNPDDSKPQLLNVARQAYLEQLKLVYQTYPDHEQAPVCLSKIHMVYAGIGVHRYALQYGDTLIEKYPDFEGTPTIMSSMFSTYDVSIEPRDTVLAKKYLRMYLDNATDLSDEDRKGFELRLRNMDKTWEEWIEWNAQNLP